MVVRSANNTDLHAVQKLLKALDLPFEDCETHIDNFIVVVSADKVIGTGGLELYADVALLRSIAVVEEYRGQGLGDTLYSEIKSRAQSLGVKELYLLTETAEQYFEARGFNVVKRDAVPAEIEHTQQFSSLCPTSATVMQLVL